MKMAALRRPRISALDAVSRTLFGSGWAIPAFVPNWWMRRSPSMFLPAPSRRGPPRMRSALTRGMASCRRTGAHRKRRMRMPIVIGGKPESDFTDPIGMLGDCHRRIVRFLHVLVALAAEQREIGRAHV